MDKGNLLVLSFASTRESENSWAVLWRLTLVAAEAISLSTHSEGDVADGEADCAAL